MRAFTIRLTLPPGWYELGRDDPGDWLDRFVAQVTDAPGDPAADALADDLQAAYAVADLVGAVDALVHVVAGERTVRAELLSYPWQSRSWLRRGPAAFAAPLVRDLRRRGHGPVQRAVVELRSGPAVRLRAVSTDELGRPAEQVLHVVVPPGAPGAVVLRMQWSADRPDAEGLTAMAEGIAQDALVEVL